MSIFTQVTRLDSPIKPVVTQPYSRRRFRKISQEPVVDPDAPTEWDDEAETIPQASFQDMASMTLPPYAWGV